MLPEFAWRPLSLLITRRPLPGCCGSDRSCAVPEARGPLALVPRPATAAAPLSVFLNHRTQKLDKTMWSVFLDQRNSTRIAGNLSRFGGQRGIGFPRRGAGMGQDWVESIGRPAIRLGGKWSVGSASSSPWCRGRDIALAGRNAGGRRAASAPEEVSGAFGG